MTCKDQTGERTLSSTSSRNEIIRNRDNWKVLLNMHVCYLTNWWNTVIQRESVLSPILYVSVCTRNKSAFMYVCSRKKREKIPSEKGISCLAKYSDQIVPLHGFRGRECMCVVGWVCSRVQLFLLVGEWSATECKLRLISIKPGVMTRVTRLCSRVFFVKFSAVFINC